MASLALPENFIYGCVSVCVFLYKLYPVYYCSQVRNNIAIANKISFQHRKLSFSYNNIKLQYERSLHNYGCDMQWFAPSSTSSVKVCNESLKTRSSTNVTTDSGCCFYLLTTHHSFLERVRMFIALSKFSVTFQKHQQLDVFKSRNFNKRLYVYRTK